MINSNIENKNSELVMFVGFQSHRIICHEKVIDAFELLSSHYKNKNNNCLILYDSIEFDYQKIFALDTLIRTIMTDDNYIKNTNQEVFAYILDWTYILKLKDLSIVNIFIEDKINKSISCISNSDKSVYHNMEVIVEPSQSTYKQNSPHSDDFSQQDDTRTVDNKNNTSKQEEIIIAEKATNVMEIKSSSPNVNNNINTNNIQTLNSSSNNNINSNDIESQVSNVDGQKSYYQIVKSTLYNIITGKLVVDVFNYIRGKKTG